ncbi:TonB-dependent receptor-like protein [Mariniflexile fucanivorans]|uniref:TonB-dependent receptor-like protein n=1 Tax=Mariniflexile fucanivorans TaxID=264023 RepID=A0A4R1RS97_9FLAO|nr:carboxypeptidase-like regulatory domain-containing protein [Mariniflexile fucanivorans]TCL68900.1 TonB-dependent receptor-like protein [Mariniflexile fucanivorans]
MKKRLFISLFGMFSICTAIAQQTIIKGSVKDAVSFEPVYEVLITIEETNQSALTNVDGVFEFKLNIPLGEQILRISKEGYITKRFPIVVNEFGMVDISDMTLEKDLTESHDLFTIMLSDDELDDDIGGIDNISGILQASMDVFQRTAAFEFSSSFFSMRGLDSDNGSVLINGIEMNKLFNGRPQWSHWGGMNDVLRNQELTTGLAPSHYNFGGILGTNNISTRASSYRSGSRITYSASNRSYTNRLMASYASGLLKNNWAFAMSLGRRWGNEGYQDATLYDSNSFFISAEKKINDKHSFNFTGIYAPNRRGKSSPNTQEVYDLKGIKYNEYWGWQDGEKRNSRIKEVEEPIFILSHYWDISKKTALTNTVAYQFGKQGNSRLDYNGTDLVKGYPEGGGSNPSASYYQKLPSYFERNFPNDLGFAYMAQQEFLSNGQINWNDLYSANISNTTQGGNAVYALYEDRVDDKQITLNSTINYQITNRIIFNASVNYKTLTSENYAKMLDLLGAKGYLDVDGYANDFVNNPEAIQNDLLNPNRIVEVGDTFKYNYNVNADVIGGYAQTQFKYNKVDFYVAGSVTNTSYQREGVFENGSFPGAESLGKGKKMRFLGYGAKAGATYKISGKHVFDFNLGYILKAPSIQNTYSNSRENHNIVPNISEEKISSIDASYIFRSSIVRAKLTGYYTKIKDANEISFFFADGIGAINAFSENGFNETANFVQEILQGVENKHIGAELGLEAQVTTGIKLKAALAIGQFTYNNNPDLYLSSEDFTNVYLGKANLKNYKQAVGPQTAFSVGFEYQDPDYWWFGATANFFSNTYIDISPLNRSSNFNTDVDGQPFNDYDETLAKTLLEQERFADYIVVNLTGGKSWRIGGKYIGLFVSVNNLLDEVYKTGGFEQSRNANFRELRDDKALNKPVFGSKYWYGRGATYFVNLNYRF